MEIKYCQILACKYEHRMAAKLALLTGTPLPPQFVCLDETALLGSSHLYSKDVTTLRRGMLPISSTKPRTIAIRAT